MTTLGHKTWVSVVLISLVLGAGCADRRPVAQKFRNSSSNYSGDAIEIGDFGLEDYVTQVASMAIDGNSLYMTGTPFYMGRWEIGAEPENPRLLAAGNYNIPAFSPMPTFGGWTVNFFGLGGLAVRNGYVYSSGNAGTSVVRATNASLLVETARYPGLDSKGNQPQDIAFQYQAIVPHPTNANLMYGFNRSDRVYTLSVNGPQLSLVAQTPYSASGGAAQMGGATSFNGDIFVAMRSYLWRVRPSGNSLQTVASYGAINAVNVVATRRFVYVHHVPIASNGNGLSAGIYVFDGANMSNAIKYIAVSPFTFAVDPTDRYMYANVDDQSVKIYQIQW